MSVDTSSNPTELDGSAGTSDAADAETETKVDTVSRQELEKAARKRDEYKRKAEKEAERAQALEAQLSSLSERISAFEEAERALAEQAAAKQGNVEELTKTLESTRTSFKKQLDDLKSSSEKALAEERNAKQALEKKLYNRFVEKALLSRLSAHSGNPAAMLVQLKAAYQFEPEEDDEGNFVGVRAKDQIRNVEELHDELCDKLNLPFKKNTRTNGTGTPPAKPKGGTQATGIPSDFDSWDRSRKVKWMAENPELAREAAEMAGKTLGR